MGLTSRFLLLSDSCGFVHVGRSLWREDGSVVYNSCWLSPVQSFSGPSPVGLVVIFYCLRFETSLFVASYDSQGHGGYIRPRLHAGWTKLSLSLMLRTTVSRPVCIEIKQPLITPCTDRVENTVSNSSSIFACGLVAVGTCLFRRRYLVTDLRPTHSSACPAYLLL
jgi:hypothetical protein